jgi:hypothetical protein
MQTSSKIPHRQRKSMFSFVMEDDKNLDTPRGIVVRVVGRKEEVCNPGSAFQNDLDRIPSD